MDNLDLIFLGCFSSFYCQLYLGLRDVQCDVLDINLLFKFSLYQSKWQHSGKIRFSALLGISKIHSPLPLLIPFVFSCSLHFTVLPRPRSIYGFTELFFLHAQGQAINCMKTIQNEQDAEKLPT